MDFLIHHLEDWKERQKDKPMMMSRLLTCWYKLDEYYTLTDQSPIYAAAVLLHPVLRKAYLDDNWKGKTKWIKAAVDAARLLWQREYKTTQQEQQQIDEPLSPYKEWRKRWYQRSSQGDEFESFVRVR